MRNIEQTKSRRRTSIFMLMIALAGSSALSDQVTIEADYDTTLSAQNFSANYCGDSALVVGHATTKAWWPIIHWDIDSSGIPEGSTINSVEIRLVQHGTSQTPNPVFFNVERITSSWSACSATFFNQPSMSSFSPTLGYIVPGWTSGARTVTLQDSGNVLRDWIDGIVNNGDPDHGLAFTTPLTGGEDYIRFRSENSGDAPELRINYTGPHDPADLAVSSVDAPNGDYLRGDNIPVDICVSNLGDEPSGDWQYKIYISKDDHFGGAQDFPIGAARTRGGINGSDISCFTDNDFDFPTSTFYSTGQWYLLIDILTSDTNNSNNQGADPTPFTVIEPPDPADLVVDSVSAPNSVYFRGDTFPVNICVSNEGDDPSGSWQYRFYLSKDAMFGGLPDHQIDPLHSHNSLDGSDSDCFDQDLTIPDDPTYAVGEWYVLLEITTPDANSSNNMGVDTTPITITCAVDLNTDGFVNLADVNLFIDWFATQNPGADLNNDGFINFADVLMFIDVFSNHC